MRRSVAAALIAAGLAGAFFAGRASVGRDGDSAPARPGGFAAGYHAGREDAFSGFDGGWDFDAPYIVTLRAGGPGVTYAFGRRWPMGAGIEYRACGHTVCSRPAP
jgi:hypothetical protein